ncbi:MAG: peptidoglycan-binding protein [Alphaproteobacteria bacterium HGW-Alphaproteobacteria-4]|jgi:hypothetical protein|nr:MAG: peptidoglycan-binding protein [Alphaproteobacteria bacterium HGW-Alphaproteobacteria-4]
MPRPLAAALCALALVAACTPEPPLPQAAPAPTLAGEISLRAPRPAEGACWAHQIRPAVIETVTEQVQVRPEQRDPSTGAVTRAASFRTETRQQIVSDQIPIWFRTLCDEQMTPDFIASLQRALRARGLYRGLASGDLDSATIRALGAYQTPRGLPSATLALATARELGLIAWETPR